MNKTARLKRLRRRLLGTLWVSLAFSSAAHATTITENPEPGGFGTTLSMATVLPGLADGSNTVIGETNYKAIGTSYPEAYVEFSDLLPGSIFSYTLSVLNTVTGTFEVLDSSGNEIGSTTSPSGFSISSLNSTQTTVTTGTATVPTDGNVIAAILQTDTDRKTITFNLAVNLTLTTVPEPGTFTEFGLGLGVAAFLLQRKLTSRRPTTAVGVS